MHLSPDDFLKGWDITGGVVSVVGEQFTEGWGDNSVSNELIVVELVEVVFLGQVATGEWSLNISVDRVGFPFWNVNDVTSGDESVDDFPDLVKGKGLEDGVEFVGDFLGEEELLQEDFLDGVLGFHDLRDVGPWEDGLNISVDGGGFPFWNVNDVTSGDESVDDFPDLVKGKGLEDGVDFVGDFLGEEELLQEDFLDGVFFFDDLRDLGPWDNLLNNIDIDDFWLFEDNLGLTSDWLNNDFLVGWGNLDISSDLGDFTDDWLVQEQSLVDLVQKELVVDAVSLVSEDIVVPGVGVWDNWRVFSVEDSAVVEDLVEVVSNGDLSALWVNILVQVLLNIDWVVQVVSVDVLGLQGDDLYLWDDVLVEEDWVAEVLLEFWDGPELLEEDGLDVPTEDDGVFFPELTEEWDVEVLSEEGCGHNLLH